MKYFLDQKGLTVSDFPQNLPSSQWARSFIELRPELSERLSENIKRARAGVNSETVNKYFDNLEVSLEGITPDCIINYDETCFVDDVGRSKIVCRRGTKHPERIIDTTKTSISVMFACSAAGDLLPPYTCYKSEHLGLGTVDPALDGSPRSYSKTGSRRLFYRIFEIKIFRLR